MQCNMRNFLSSRWYRAQSAMRRTIRYHESEMRCDDETWLVGSKDVWAMLEVRQG